MISPALATADRKRLLEGLRLSLRGDVRSMREVQTRIGRTLLEIRRLGDPLSMGATTFPIFCEREGLSPTEAREFTAMAEAAERLPEVETRVAEARLSPQKAALVNDVLKSRDLQKPGEDLLDLAESRSSKDLLHEVRKRREEARLGRPPVTLTLQVSEKGRDDFRRCRTLVSRSLDRMASEGETLERVCDEFLRRHDPERKARRLEGRDLEATSKAPLKEAAEAVAGLRRTRHIPEADLRALLRVAGDRCWVEGCPNEVFLQSAHRRPFRANGSNRARNLVRLCRTHHAQMDGGLWRLVPRRDGAVVLIDSRGVSVGRLRAEAAGFLDEVRSRGRAPP